MYAGMRKKVYLNPGGHSSQEIIDQAGMFGIVAGHKKPIHHKAFPQIASDDESSVKQQHNIECEQETCNNMVKMLGKAQEATQVHIAAMLQARQIAGVNTWQIVYLANCLRV